MYARTQIVLKTASLRLEQVRRSAVVISHTWGYLCDHVCKINQSNCSVYVGISWRNRRSWCYGEQVCTNLSEGVWSKVFFKMKSIDVNGKV